MMPSMPNWFSTPVGSGMNGCQLSGFTKNAPTPMKARITVTLMATMMLLTVADSETPRTSSIVTASVMNTAGRLNSADTTDAAGMDTTVADGSWTMDEAGTLTTVPAISSRSPPVAGSSTLVAAASVACVSAGTVMSTALIN